jgi:hypothetical protein
MMRLVCHNCSAVLKNQHFHRTQVDQISHAVRWCQACHDSFAAQCHNCQTWFEGTLLTVISPYERLCQGCLLTCAQCGGQTVDQYLSWPNDQLGSMCPDCYEHQYRACQHCQTEYNLEQHLACPECQGLSVRIAMTKGEASCTPSSLWESQPLAKAPLLNPKQVR